MKKYKLNSNIIIQNLIPSLIKNNDLPLNFNIYELTENSINPIISLLYKYINFFEMYFIKIISSDNMIKYNNNDFQYNNQLITQYSYVTSLNNTLIFSVDINQTGVYTDEVIQFDDGNYNPKSFNALLLAQLTSFYPTCDFQVTFSSITNKITISSIRNFYFYA